MAAGVTEDWLAGLETPEGIRGRSAAIDVAEDAPNGDGEHEEQGIAGSVPLDSGGGQRCSWRGPSGAQRQRGSGRNVAFFCSPFPA